MSKCQRMAATTIKEGKTCYPSGTLYSGFGQVLKDLKHTISSSDILPSSPASDKFESAGVDFRRLPENVSLAACKFSVRALEAFRFRGMAENEDDRCFQGHNQHNLEVQILILETPSSVLGQK